MQQVINLSGKIKDEMSQQVLHKEKFRKITIECWYNELEGNGFKDPRREAYCGIPRDISEREMKSLLELFQSTYGKELNYRIEIEKPVKIRGTREPITKRVMSVWYAN